MKPLLLALPWWLNPWREVKRLRSALVSRNTPTPDLLEFAADRLVRHGDSPIVYFVQALRREAERQRQGLNGQWPCDGMDWYFDGEQS